MKSAGQAISDSLKQSFNLPKEVLTDVGREYKQSILKTSRKGMQPDGSKRQKLNSKYRRRKVNKGVNPIRDHYYSGDAFRNFYHEQSQNTIGFDYQDSKVHGYMKGHEDKAESGQNTRMYPIEKDTGSSEQKEVIRFVEKRILEMLNELPPIKAQSVARVKL